MKAFKSSSICFVNTLNKMGYMALHLDKYNQNFVQYCIDKKEGQYLDIGCAFGISTLPIVEAGGRIVACDLEQKHLEILKSKVDLKFSDNIQFVEGHLPRTLRFKASSFEAINLSMVLHFLSGEEIIQSLNLISQWLKPKGKLYITTSSPYQGTLKKFISIYEKNLKQNLKWPGVIEDISLYIPERSKDLPKFNHVFTPEVLKKILEKEGFEVSQYGYFSRQKIPLDIAYDGREYTGLICQKF